MRRIIILAALGLVGCNQATTTGATIIKIVDDVQAVAMASCKFVPTATTIANIVSAGSTAVPSAIANEVCNAVNSMPVAALSSNTPPAVIVNGKTITVEGHHI
jgi:hypothetical protein